MKIKALIEKTDTGYCSISCDEKIGNFFMFFLGLETASVPMACLVAFDKYKNISVTYQYDLQSFFDCFDWINITKFAQVAGVNESKLRLYKVGKAFAGERTKAKLQSAIKRMSAELASVTL